MGALFFFESVFIWLCADATAVLYGDKDRLGGSQFWLHPTAQQSIALG